jgi:uncharacterized protein (TIGR03437 family)
VTVQEASIQVKAPKPALIPAGARRLVQFLVLALPLAALAAGGSPNAAWKKAGADDGLRRAFERASEHPLAVVAPAWTQILELTASDGVPGDRFGNSVSVSGNTAVIGASESNGAEGAAYVFVQSGGVWSLQQKLTVSYTWGSSSGFGSSVSVSGDTAVIGAPGESFASQYNRGAAYVFVRGGGAWSQRQKLTATDGAAGDEFGSSVSVSGSTAVIGAGGRNNGQGAAYVFFQSGGVWSQWSWPELTASDGGANDHFGYSVSVSGDTAVIGAYGNNNYQGGAYVFVPIGGVWTQRQELTASDGVAGDGFGYSVSVSGDAAVFGAPAKDYNQNWEQGVAYVFVQSGGGWSQQQELTASDGAWDNGFGSAVSVSGDVAVIGAASKTINYQAFQGAAYVFVQSAGTWSQQQELTASDGAGNDQFGTSVSVSGVVAVIGANQKTVHWYANQGAAYLFATTQPLITGLGVSGGGASIAQNAWMEVYIANLLPPTMGAGLTWSSAPSFASGQMPTELGGVSVTVNGKPAYIYFVSPAQVNVLTPLDSTIGPVAVVVNNGTATSAAFTVNMQAASPGFLRFGDGIHIAAEHADYSLLGPASMSVPGYTFTPATPGETILLFGDGFGVPASTLTAGSEYQTGALPTLPHVTFCGATATVQYAGLISPGLYQINVVVPASDCNGDNAVIATYAGASSPSGAMIAVSQ